MAIVSVLAVPRTHERQLRPRPRCYQANRFITVTPFNPSSLHSVASFSDVFQREFESLTKAIAAIAYNI